MHGDEPLRLTPRHKPSLVIAAQAFDESADDEIPATADPYLEIEYERRRRRRNNKKLETYIFQKTRH
jgi:hypothetical protein